MSSSREGSPDWLRSFQPPSASALTLSSDSELSPHGSSSEDDEVDHDKLPLRKFLQVVKKSPSKDVVGTECYSLKKTSKAKSPQINQDVGNTQSEKHGNSQIRKGNKKVAEPMVEVPEEKKKANGYPVSTISSDSEACPDNGSENEDKSYHVEESSQPKTSEFHEMVKGEEGFPPDDAASTPSKKVYRRKTVKREVQVEDTEQKPGTMEKNVDETDMDIIDEEIHEKQREPQASSSRLPLILSEKVQRTKALVECEGDSVDLSGDMGAVGRVVISDTPSGNQDMYLDLKGTIYKTTILPCRTFCVVSFGPSEAKVEAIMNDYIQLDPQSDFQEGETMVEGTLEGYSFDSDDEADKLPTSVPNGNDKNEGGDEQTNGKAKRKADKSSGPPRKKAKTAGSKPQAPKKAKKTRVTKKATKKK